MKFYITADILKNTLEKDSILFYDTFINMLSKNSLIYLDEEQYIMNTYIKLLQYFKDTDNDESYNLLKCWIKRFTDLNQIDVNSCEYSGKSDYEHSIHYIENV